MSATMARQGGRVQLEQSDMRLALNMAKMAKGGFLRAAIEEMQHLMKKPRAEVQEEKKWGVEFPGHRKVKDAIEQHPAMVYENHTDSCLPCQNGTAKNPWTCWRRKGTGAPPQVQLIQPTTELTPPPPGTPPVPPADKIVAKVPNSQISPADMDINMLPFTTLNFSIMIHIRRIVSTMMILFQICGMMKEHPLVSTLSAAW